MKRGGAIVAAAVLVTACTSAGETGSTGQAATTATPDSTAPITLPIFPEVDLSARPMIWFSPHPAVNLPGFVKGSHDYFDLFSPGSDWPEGIHVFKIHDQIGLARDPTDEELLQVITGLRERGIPLAMELGALPPHPGFGPIGAEGECGEGIEGFSGVVAVQTVQRIKDLGGRVSLVAFDEPFAHGHFYELGDGCQWSVKRVAREVAAFVSRLREVEPDIVVGDIEPTWPEIGADAVAAWLDAYESAAGEPMDFFHLDVDWGNRDWPEVAREIEDVVRSHGVSFGIIYNGGDDAASDAEWVQLSADRAFTYEMEGGGRPDHVILQSWQFRPQRVLPSGDPTTFTGLIERYLAPRSAIEATSDSGVLDGRLTTAVGDPVSGAEVTVDLRPLDGVRQALIVDGVVPDEARLAEIGIRINTEGAGPGPADLRIYEVQYAEGDEKGNRVPDPDFGYLAQFAIPGVAVVPSDSGDGTMLRLTAQPDDDINLGSERFPVTPGAPYRLTVDAAVPLASAGSGYAAVVFLVDAEVDRHIIPLAPIDEDGGTVTTGEDGRFSIPLPETTGAYRIRVSYAGDLGSWPAWTTLTD
ncbi:MAG: hypothetical protein ACXWXS_02340 [Actinomycetota bacterium]